MSTGVSGAVLAAFSVSGCNRETRSVTPAQAALDVGAGEQSRVPAEQPEPKVNNNRRRPALVAPIFRYGVGRGSTGCIVMSPPVFLSEEEAMVVIKEELAACGVVLDTEGVGLDEVRVAPAIIWPPEVRGESQPVTMDAEDAGKGILVEFVSQKDYHPMGGEYDSSSVQDYDLLRVATQLRNKAEMRLSGGVCGVFYDPLTRWQELPDEEMRRMPWRETRQQAARASQALLRQQVRDFVEWLREQKVI